MFLEVHLVSFVRSADAVFNKTSPYPTMPPLRDKNQLRKHPGDVHLIRRSHDALSYLPQVSRDLDVVPGVVVKLAVDGFDERLEGAGAKVDDEPDGATLQRQVHVIGRFARVEHEAISLQGSEGQCDLVRAALDRGHGQVIAEKLIAFERRHRFFFTC